MNKCDLSAVVEREVSDNTSDKLRSQMKWYKKNAAGITLTANKASKMIG